MSVKPKEKKPLRLFHLPWQIFLIITVVVLIATFLGVLPKGMAGCFIFMIVVGDILAWIGDHTPIIKDYLGGGAIVVIFGSALLVFFNLIPAHVAPKAADNKAAATAITAVNESVDQILVHKAAQLKKDGGQLEADTPYEVVAVIKDGKVEAVKEAAELTDVEEGAALVRVVMTLDVEQKESDTVAKVKTLTVAGENLAEEAAARITAPSFADYYIGAESSSKVTSPVQAMVNAANTAVDSILTGNSTRVAGKAYTAVALGYKNNPVKVTVTFDEQEAIQTVQVDALGHPQEAVDYAASEAFTSQYVGKTGYNMLLPFGKLDLLGNIGTFFKTTGGFLDWYIAALITGSILGMNRKLLIKAAARYFPAIFGGLILAFGLCMGVAALMGYPVMNALLLISLPIMGGGMGAGASPLSKIFEGSGSMSAAQALSVMTPAVAIGNAISIVLAGVLVKVMRGKMNGNGALMQAGSIDPKELEISPEMQQKRDHIELKNLGIGLLVSGAFFAIGYILQGCWDALGTGITVHAYAWMIITVAVCKVTNIVPENIEVACYQWFQFIMKNLTNVLLLGIGVCYLEIGTVISSFSLTYLLLCAATCIGAFVGAAFIGRLVGFYPFESGVTAGLCMSNMGGTGDVAVLSAANRMELMPFAQISSRLGGAVILLIASLMLSVLAQFLAPLA